MLDLGDTNLLLPLMRGVFVAALFSAFGALLFIWLVAPQGLKLAGARDAEAIEGRCLRLIRASLVAALFALLGWLALEASDMSEAANATDALAAIPAVLLETSFGHDLTAQGLSVFAALRASRSVAAAMAVCERGAGGARSCPSGRPQPRLRHGTWPEPLALCGRTAPSCRRCLARRIAAAADPGPRRPIKARRRNAETLLKARHALRHRHRRDRLLPRLGSRRRRGWSIWHRLWLSASPQGGALCRVARARRHQPLSPHPGAGTPRRTAGEVGALAHHRGRDRARAHGGARRRRAERPRARHACPPG